MRTLKGSTWEVTTTPEVTRHLHSRAFPNFQVGGTRGKERMSMRGRRKARLDVASQLCDAAGNADREPPLLAGYG